MGASGDLLESSAVEDYRQGRGAAMSGELTPAVLMAKAVRAGASARVLLDLDDVDGACNRADYAMFDAARAALLTSGALVHRRFG